MNYIDVEEFARISGKTESYIRRLCRDNKLPYIQEQVPQTGRHKYLIDIDSQESQKYLLPIQKQNSFGGEPEQVPQQNFTNTETLQELLDAKDHIIALQNKMLQYAEQAGQVKLLEDIEKRKESEYLRQISFLKSQIAVLEKENAELKLKLSKKSFLGIKF